MYLGPFLLTNLLLEKIESSGSGRIINLTNPNVRNKIVMFDNLNSTMFYNPYTTYLSSKLLFIYVGQLLWVKLKGEGKDKYIILIHALDYDPYFNCHVFFTLYDTT